MFPNVIGEKWKYGFNYFEEDTIIYTNKLFIYLTQHLR